MCRVSKAHRKLIQPDCSSVLKGVSKSSVHNVLWNNLGLGFRVGSPSLPLGASGKFSLETATT